MTNIFPHFDFKVQGCGSGKRECASRLSNEVIFAPESGERKGLSVDSLEVDMSGTERTPLIL